jgi:HK97 family phage portal protein
MKKNWISGRFDGWRTWLQKQIAPMQAAALSLDALPQRWNQRQLVEEGYARNPTVFACVQHVARAAAGVPWVLYRRGGSGTKIERVMTASAAMKALSAGRQQRKATPGITEIEDHPLLQLMERPNSMQGGAEFIEAITAHLLISGNSYTVGVGPNAGPPRELWPLLPQYMRAVLDVTGDIAEYVHTTVGGSVVSRLAARDVMHLRLFNPLGDSGLYGFQPPATAALDGGVYGFPPMMAAAFAIDSDNEATRWNYNLLRNSARPSGALTFEPDRSLTPPMMDRLVEDIKKNYAGARNAGGLLLLHGGLKWQALSLTPSELNWLEGRKLSRREIAQVFGVPPELIGDVEARSYASYSEARRAFYHETVLPYMDRLRDHLNTWLTPRFGDDLRLDYDRDDIEALQEDRSALWSRVQSAEWLTINEKRRATGYDDIGAEGDVVMISSAMMPLGALTTAPAPGD